MDFYHASTPAFLTALAETVPMRRLRNVGMNCGCEYTRFPRFLRLLPYSRYTHSVGVAQIVWHFTQDPAQATAGLLHDVATPTFSHVVDFLRGDYLTQEATENGTRRIIEEDAELQAALRACGLATDEVCDYHRYPIADNDSPRLSADRLEYTLGNMVNFGLGTVEDARLLYEDLRVGENEDGAPELAFGDPKIALRFAGIALACSEVYVSDEDRYAMEMLAVLLREAIEAGVLTEADLMTDEPQLLEKLCRKPFWAAKWQAFCGMCALEKTYAPIGEGWRRIDAKRRAIDPLIDGQGRASALFPDFGERLHAFRTKPLDVWLRATNEENI